MKSFSSSGHKNPLSLIFISSSCSCVSPPLGLKSGGWNGNLESESRGSSGNCLLTRASSGNTAGTGLTFRSTVLYMVKLEGILLEFLVVS